MDSISHCVPTFHFESSLTVIQTKLQEQEGERERGGKWNQAVAVITNATATGHQMTIGGMRPK